MEELLAKSLINYYSRIFKTGYFSEDEVEKLLILTFITENYNKYSEEEQLIIDKVLSCLKKNSCLIPKDFGLC